MFETHVTFGTHSSRVETRFTLGWLDDQVLATMSLEARWKLLNALSSDIAWQDNPIAFKEFEIAWKVASVKAFDITWREFNSSSANFSWKEFSRRQQRIAWEILTIPHILVPVQDGVWKEVELNFCPLVELNQLMNIASFSKLELNLVINEETDMMYGAIRSILLEEDYYIIDSLFRTTDIAYDLAKIYVLHRVAMKLYFLKYPMADFDLKIQGWADLSKDAIMNLKAHVRNVFDSLIPTKPVWIAPAQLFVEKGVGGVSEGTISVSNVQKNIRYAR
jgi:hypothetical protein